MQDAAFIKKVKQVTLIAAAAYIVLGMVLLLFPTQVSQFIGYALGGVAIAFGIYRLVLYFMRNRTAQLLAGDLYAGIILEYVGIYIIMHHQEAMDFLAMICGIFLTAGCIIKLQNAIDLKRIGQTFWWMILLFGIISLILAVLSILNIRLIADHRLVATGAFLLYDGISGLITVLMLWFGQRNAEKPDRMQNFDQTVRENEGAVSAEEVESFEPNEDDFDDDDIVDQASGEKEESLDFDPETGESL